MSRCPLGLWAWNREHGAHGRSLSAQAICCEQSLPRTANRPPARPGSSLSRFIVLLARGRTQDWWGKFLPTTLGEPGRNPDPGGFAGLVSDLASELGISTSRSRVLFCGFPLHPNIRSPRAGEPPGQRRLYAVSLHPGDRLVAWKELIEPHRAENCGGGTVSE